MYDLDEVTGVNNEYIESSARVNQFFNNTRFNRCPLPQKLVFDNGSEFKRDFTTLIKDFDIKTVLMTTKNPQDNAPVEWVHQVILNMLVTKDIANKVFDYIDPWVEILSYIE